MYHLQGLVFDKSLGAIMLAASGLCSSGYWSWGHSLVRLNSNKQHRKKFKIIAFIQTKFKIVMWAVYYFRYIGVCSVVISAMKKYIKCNAYTLE